MRTRQKIINLYQDSTIFSIKYVISIDSEEELNQFWHFVSYANRLTPELIHPFITQFYNFALSYITYEKAEFFEIILEESVDNFYFTLWNKKIALSFKKYIEKTSLEFIYNKNQISIKLEKLKLQKKIQKISSKNIQREKHLIKSVTKKKELKKLEPYTFLEESDLEELLKLSEDLQELAANIKKNGLNHDTFISLRSVVSLFCTTLRYYDKIAPITTTLTHFSNLINQNREKFITLSSQELSLVSGFIANIDYWFQTLFIHGGADIYFMDNSMKADCKMIFKLTNNNKNIVKEINLEGIFNF